MVQRRNRSGAIVGIGRAPRAAGLVSVTQSLVNKILHTPFTELKQAAARPDRSQFVRVARSIFRLEGYPAGAIAPAN